MANILPAQTSELETAEDTGNWDPWFSSTVTQSTAEANQGTGSLAITATDSFAAVQLDNFPGFSADPGEYAVSWALFGSTGATGVWSLEWRDSSNSTIQTDDLPINTSTGTWVTASDTITAPAATVALWMTITFDGTATADETYFADSFVVDDEPGGAADTVTAAPVALTLTAVAATTAAGAVTVAASPVALTLTPQAADTVAGAVTIQAAPVALTLTAVPGATAGASVIAAQPVVFTLAPQPATLTGGAVIAAQPVVLTLASRPAATAAGAATVFADPVALTLTALAANVIEGVIAAPAARITTVPAESRRHVVPAESRRATVPGHVMEAA